MSKVASDRSASLKEILERSKLLTNQVLQQELPPIERGLEQIDVQSSKLTSKTAQHEDSGDNKALYFLAQGGVDSQVLMRDLGTIHIGTQPEHRRPIQDTDVEGYFQQKRAQTIIELVQNKKEEIIQDGVDQFDKSVDTTWKAIKTSLCEVRGEDPTDADMAFLRITKSHFDPARLPRRE
ncbi:hypothetical protein EC973_003108 [Apophysomyces ossiformis]|uniref:Uncharacterized protein n=1 Tax=Apophysomyces ossiformis TaxID=679940 RepID=A0A8H7EQS1_9FUNG|nr:hypothetical protein EC973_003108 [Apophysomyces ossiformis]